jgi:hypothetical protein
MSVFGATLALATIEHTLRNRSGHDRECPVCQNAAKARFAVWLSAAERKQLDEIAALMPVMMPLAHCIGVLRRAEEMRPEWGV